MAYLIGIDTSTTSSKALIIDDQGNVIAVASSPHTLQSPKPLWSEAIPLNGGKQLRIRSEQCLRIQGFVVMKSPQLD